MIELLVHQQFLYLMSVLQSLVHFYIMEFFFSSRRRHTRWPRDWSSDVCSSDLVSTTTSQTSNDVCDVVVLTARIELAWLSPLPPQDSVSTNSTTSALGLGCITSRCKVHNYSIT